ncbi:single-stranded DNA-binding protein [Catellatospora tritici]|uniref:single-stranded DNA-binding protein n=1 Tax=Catellatospora tritici TaxID=2851566 RepID=UPI001C2D68FA|nr:single-stranded DNA-binding protein [Catellatospora tritici]MBV1851898.1 single-stranded DNA-binding protein [Catellatospora tritici]
MANETTLTLVGNLTADPDLRYTPAGVALCKFSVASTPRVFDSAKSEWRDGDPLFMNCMIWRDMAENVAESLRKGARVVVTGRLRLNQWTTPEGEKRSGFQLDVEDIGASLRYVRAEVKKLVRTGGGQAAASGDSPWETSGADPEPPF